MVGAGKSGKRATGEDWPIISSPPLICIRSFGVIKSIPPRPTITTSYFRSKYENGGGLRVNSVSSKIRIDSIRRINDLSCDFDCLKKSYDTGRSENGRKEKFSSFQQVFPLFNRETKLFTRAALRFNELWAVE